MVLASIITTLGKNLQSGYFVINILFLLIIILNNIKFALQTIYDDPFVDLTVKHD